MARNLGVKGIAGGLIDRYMALDATLFVIEAKQRGVPCMQPQS